jgi:hypothetical protein
MGNLISGINSSVESLNSLSTSKAATCSKLNLITTTKIFDDNTEEKKWFEPSPIVLKNYLVN